MFLPPQDSHAKSKDDDASLRHGGKSTSGPRPGSGLADADIDVDMDAAAAAAAAADFRPIDPHSGVKRGLKTRHLSMMALAGIIGPGLLIGSGGALSAGGPASLLIGFAVIGLVAFSVMQSLGELTTLYPTGGAFAALADRFVDKAFGVAVGWNYYIVWFCVLANEYNVISSIMVFWSDRVPVWGYFLIFWVRFNLWVTYLSIYSDEFCCWFSPSLTPTAVCLPRLPVVGRRDVWGG